jgi:hypothetical protein
MANLQADGPGIGMGQDGRRFHVPVDGGTTIYANTMVSVLEATGMLVPTSTAGAGPCIGVAVHGADNADGSDGDIRCMVETGRVYRLTNGTSGDAFSDATPLYSPAYALDDNSVADNSNSGALQKCGVFMGMEADGKVRVLISPEVVSTAKAIQSGTGTLVAGVLTVDAGITVTAQSVVVAMRKTEAGTDGDELRCPSADRTVGGPGTGAITIRAFSAGSAATSDTSTIDWIIVG